MNKLGTYKENGVVVTYLKNGLQISVVPNPMDTNIDEFDKLPEGHKFPESKWENDPFVSHSWVEIDFENGTIKEL